MFRIGEFAQLAGVTAKALRNYDARGILHPVWVDPVNRYRYYSPAQLPELRRMLALRSLGIPMSEVASIVRRGGDLRTALQRRRHELELVQARIARDLATLDIRVEMAGQGPDVVIRSVASQLVAVLSPQEPHRDDVASLFYLLEGIVRDAGLRASLPPGMLLTPESEHQYEIFVPVKSPVTGDRIQSRRLPARRVAAVIHRGPYEGMADIREDTVRWVQAAGYRQIDRIRILYLQFGAESELDIPPAYIAHRPSDFVTEIQIPIDATNPVEASRMIGGDPDSPWSTRGRRTRSGPR